MQNFLIYFFFLASFVGNFKQDLSGLEIRVCVCLEWLENITPLVIGSLTVLIGGFMGLKWVQYRALDGKYVKSRVEQYKQLADESKKEMQKVKGKLSQKFQDIQVEGDYDLSQKSDLGSLAKQVLPSILQALPPDIQKQAKGFLNNPEMVDMALGLYEKHPEEIKNLLARFIKKGGSKASNKEGEFSADTSQYA